MAICFKREMDFEYGVVDHIADGVRRVIAHNPGPFTFTGTGTYILGRGGGVAVIDPGPLLDEHIDAICAALNADEYVSHILITHTHADHSPGAGPLQVRTGAPTYGFYSPSVQAANNTGDIVSEEATDIEFIPDNKIQHGDIIEGDSWRCECVYTPGHMANHICYAFLGTGILFTGDHVMGWSTSVIAPPDGKMRDYMASLQHLLTRADKIYWPTHGPSIDNPHEFVRDFIAHREAREAQILEQLIAGLGRISDIVETLYRDVDKGLHPAACLSVFAHMQDLVARGRVRASEVEPTLHSDYSAV